MRDFEKVKTALTHPNNKYEHLKPLHNLLENFVRLYPVWKFTEYYRELSRLYMDLDSKLIDEKFKTK
jgi:hypothetical protein